MKPGTFCKYIYFFSISQCLQQFWKLTDFYHNWNLHFGSIFPMNSHHQVSLASLPGLTSTSWHCHKPFSQWQDSFLWKLPCHRLKSLLLHTAPLYFSKTSPGLIRYNTASLLEHMSIMKLCRTLSNSITNLRNHTLEGFHDLRTLGLLIVWETAGNDHHGRQYDT